MSRYIRNVGEYGYMHIVKRGINRQDVFLDTADYKHFLELLTVLKDEMGFEVIAYCLMSNHMHLLIYDEKFRFSVIVQRLYSRYARYFNKKYERTGGLFEGRFCGKPVNTEQYLLTVVRYIHNNPVNAGICLAEDYPWSSYHEYVSENLDTTGFCNRRIILALLGGREAFIKFHNSPLGANDCAHLIEIAIMEGNTEIEDNEVRYIIQNMIQGKSPFALQKMAKNKRDGILVQLKEMGLKHQQIARVTGISVSVIKKAKRTKETGYKSSDKKIAAPRRDVAIT